jgi:uncharacterized protein
MIIVRQSSHRIVPWKNGGGVTREILREPAEPADFHWRLSLATIDSAGPFSSFDGYQRTLVLVRGAGLELDFDQHGHSRLTAPGQSVSFDGGWQTRCTLLDGPCSDLNLIVARERVQSASHAALLEEARIIQTAHWTEVLLCCLSGVVRLTNSAGEVASLGSVDVARCAPSDGAINCVPEAAVAEDTEPSTLFVACVRRRDT